MLSSRRAWYCRRSHRAARSDTGTVIVLCVVPQAQLLRRAWYRRHCHCAARGVTGVVVVPRVVSQGLLSCHVWCRGWCCWTAWSRGYGGHAACGVTVTIVTACDVVIASWSLCHMLSIAVITPRVVSQSQLSCHVVPQERGEWTKKSGS